MHKYPERFRHVAASVTSAAMDEKLVFVEASCRDIISSFAGSSPLVENVRLEAEIVLAHAKSGEWAQAQRRAGYLEHFVNVMCDD